jgi:hypothetical protein
MKKILISFLAGSFLLISSSCQDWLDVNRNPNGPEKVTAYLYLGAMQQQMPLSMQWDARMLDYYTQNFAYYSTNYAYDRQGTPAWTSDMAEHWRTVYWKFGINLTDMISISEAEERWDLAGIGYAIKAWGWQMLTDMHGPVIYKEAFKPGLYSFAYDEQQLVYEEVVKICEKAIENLNRTDGTVSAAFAGKGDQIYAGNRIKWKKFTYGLLAINMSHLSNKSALYKPDKILSYVDSAFTSNADNALIGFAGSVSADASFFGPMRNNYAAARVSKFMVSLMDGTVFGAADPRIKIMLPPSDNIVKAVAGAKYIGVEPNIGYTPIAAADRPYNIYGLNSISTPATGTIGMYLFTNNVKWPLMTYSELQFIKAEAALRKGDKVTALAAYNNGVSSAIDFANTYVGATTLGTAVAVSGAEKTAFLTAVVPTDASALTMSKIMCQKYIHLWAWAPMETWTDMRRYHYTDKYAGETKQVFDGFVLPPLASENNGKLIYRVRPRYNSEYVWNAAELDKIGALATDYHTKEIWFSIPE